MALLENLNKDYEWFCGDNYSYSAEMDRQDKEFAQQFAKHMGKEFSQKYKPTRKELESSISNTTASLNRLLELKAPDEIRESYQQYLADLLQDLKAGNYILTKEEQDYRDRYEAHESKFQFRFVPNVPDEYK